MDVQPTDRQAQVLRIIRRQEVPTMGEIAEAGHLSYSQAKTAVTALVHLRLVEQGPSGFKPGATFHLTDAGRAYLAR
jgi:DNA-binding IclR family transcriptional regulator